MKNKEQAKTEVLWGFFINSCNHNHFCEWMFVCPFDTRSSTEKRDPKLKQKNSDRRKTLFRYIIFQCCDFTICRERYEPSSIAFCWINDNHNILLLLLSHREKQLLVLWPLFAAFSLFLFLFSSILVFLFRFLSTINITSAFDFNNEPKTAVNYMQFNNDLQRMRIHDSQRRRRINENHLTFRNYYYVLCCWGYK